MTVLEKFFAVEEEWLRLKAFLDWLQSRYEVCTVEDTHGDQYANPYWSAGKSGEELLAEFFDIDLGALAAEKEAHLGQRLDELRQQWRPRQGGAGG